MNARNLLNLGLAAVLLAVGGLIWFVQNEPPELEPERLTPLSEAEITRIEIRPTRHADALLERRGTAWWLVEPFSARADAAKINAVAGLVRAASLARYAASAVDAGQAGLAAPDLVLRINDTTLTLGGTEPLKGRRFVRIGDDVHLILDRYSYLLQGGPASLVSPRLLPAGARLGKITLPEWRLSQRDGQWQLAGGEAVSADALQTLVDAWQHARALKVSRADAQAAGEMISLQFSNDAPPLRFILQQREDETLFIRTDLGLAYHFMPAVAERLLTPQRPADEAGGA